MRKIMTAHKTFAIIIFLLIVVITSHSVLGSMSIALEVRKPPHGRNTALYRAPAVYNSSSGVTSRNYIITSRPVDFLANEHWTNHLAPLDYPLEDLFQIKTTTTKKRPIFPAAFLGQVEWDDDPPPDSATRPGIVEHLDNEVVIPINLQQLIWSLDPDGSGTVKVKPTNEESNLQANVEKSGASTIVKIVTKRPWMSAYRPSNSPPSFSSFSSTTARPFHDPVFLGTVAAQPLIVQNPHAVTTNFWGSARPTGTPVSGGLSILPSSSTVSPSWLNSQNSHFLNPTSVITNHNPFTISTTEPVVHVNTGSSPNTITVSTSLNIGLHDSNHHVPSTFHHLTRPPGFSTSTVRPIVIPSTISTTHRPPAVIVSSPSTPPSFGVTRPPIIVSSDPQITGTGVGGGGGMVGLNTAPIMNWLILGLLLLPIVSVGLPVIMNEFGRRRKRDASAAAEFDIETLARLMRLLDQEPDWTK